ncbi:MAG: 2-amino-4-hydroxy-6-hydroxymethyldihydropteridine diphosphokinase, partial [Thiohalomonadales bacterium]|nr:2-amino-4-hydroxy-6-hydroxymethyldihydropteridine diphosphokinase [Thiohalomonadales bacterium]
MKPGGKEAGSITEPVTTYIGLGSNLEQPVEQIKRALQQLAEIPQSRMISHSPIYRSSPMGPADQPDYINAVAVLATSLAPLELLDALQAIEQQHGRIRGEQRWGPRTLDLDIL